MRKIRDVLKLRHGASLSLEEIARALKLSKGVVAKYLRLAQESGLNWPLPPELDDADLERRLYPRQIRHGATYAEPDCARIHQELKRKGVTQKWSGLFEQIFLIYKWKTCGVTLPREPLAAVR